MTVKSYYVRNMLLQYDKQLTTARRIARYRQALQMARGEDTTVVPRDVKRTAMVERVAREVMENLLVSGSDNPVVQEIKSQLEQELGEKLLFKYPPTDLDLQIFREGQNGPEEISPAEKAVVMEKLWTIALDKVNDTML